MQDKFIMLSHSIIRDKSMTMQEKIIYMEILNLTSIEDGCFASNNHFEISFGISKKSASNTINSLIKKGFIESDLSDRNHKRLLSIKDGQTTLHKRWTPSIKDGESKGNKTNTVPNEENKEFESLWSDFSVLAKRNKFQAGNKKKAYTKYLDLVKKDFTPKKIYETVELEAEKEYAQRHLITILNQDFSL